MATKTQSGYVAIEGSVSTAEEAIRLCGSALVGAGFVNEGFAQGCVDREAEFPTGICSEIPVALPHCMSEDIIKSAVCYLRLAEPVAFRRMDNDESTVLTRHVFNLAIDRGDHLSFLSRIMGALQDPDILLGIEQMPIEEVAAFLKGLIETTKE